MQRESNDENKVNNPLNDTNKKSLIALETATKDEKTKIKQIETQTNDNDNNQEDEFIAVKTPKQFAQPNQIPIVESLQPESTDENEVNSESNIDITPVNLETLSFKTRNKTKGIEIQSLPTSESFKAKIVDEIRKQKGFDTIEAHHIEITRNDGKDIMDDYFTEHKVVLTGTFAIKVTNDTESGFTGTKIIQIHWLNEKFSWESLEIID